MPFFDFQNRFQNLICPKSTDNQVKLGIYLESQWLICSYSRKHFDMVCFLSHDKRSRTSFILVQEAKYGIVFVLGYHKRIWSVRSSPDVVDCWIYLDAMQQTTLKDVTLSFLSTWVYLICSKSFKICPLRVLSAKNHSALSSSKNSWELYHEEKLVLLVK